MATVITNVNQIDGNDPKFNYSKTTSSLSITGVSGVTLAVTSPVSGINYNIMDVISTNTSTGGVSIGMYSNEDDVNGTVERAQLIAQRATDDSGDNNGQFTIKTLRNGILTEALTITEEGVLNVPYLTSGIVYSSSGHLMSATGTTIANMHDHTKLISPNNVNNPAVHVDNSLTFTVDVGHMVINQADSMEGSDDASIAFYRDGTIKNNIGMNASGDGSDDFDITQMRSTPTQVFKIQKTTGNVGIGGIYYPVGIVHVSSENTQTRFKQIVESAGNPDPIAGGMFISDNGYPPMRRCMAGYFADSSSIRIIGYDNCFESGTNMISGYGYVQVVYGATVEYAHFDFIDGEVILNNYTDAIVNADVCPSTGKIALVGTRAGCSCSSLTIINRYGHDVKLMYDINFWVTPYAPV